MKKYLFLSLLIISLALFGCNKETSKVDTPEEVSDESKEKTEEEEVNVDLDKKLGFTTNDVMDLELFTDTSERLRVYQLDNGMKIESMGSKNAAFTFFLYYLEKADYPSAFFIRNTGSNTDLTFETLEVLYSNYSDEELEVIEVLKDEGEDYHIAGFIFNEEVHHSELPFSLPEITEDDFFVKGVTKDEFDKLNDSGNYTELLKITDEYIKNNDVKDYDSVNDVATALEPIRNHLDKVKVIYDDFNDSADIFFNDLTDISASNYVVPFISTNQRFMELLIGFEKNGWLFTDKYTFNVDGEMYTDSSVKFERDTLGGRKIRETYTSSYKSELVESIISGTDVKLRFEGDKGKLDYSLTEKDKQAFEVINAFNEVHHNLSDLIFRFYK